jgi:hypothetical protein
LGDSIAVSGTERGSELQFPVAQPGELLDGGVNTSGGDRRLASGPCFAGEINKENHMKKLLLASVVVAMPLGMVAVGAATDAGASIPTITADGTMNCSVVGGAIKFSPALHSVGTANSDTTTVASTLSGCTPSGNTNLKAGSVVTGKVGSVVTTTTTDNSANSCGGLATPKAQTLTVKWTSKVAGVVVQKLTNTVITFSSFDAVFNGTVNPGFDLPGDTGGTASATSTSSFQGSDGGASSTSNAFAKLTAAKLGAKCGSSIGLTALPLGAAGTAADPSASFAG